MTLAALLEAAGVPHEAGPDYTIAQCDHATLAGYVRAAGIVADALIVDAPYSERTHAGHDDGTATANRMLDFARRRQQGGLRKDRVYAEAKAARTGAHRRSVAYTAWTLSDVAAFLGAWSDSCGWLLSLTDTVLARAWESVADDVGRYTFAPIACVESGSRVRMTGDGPPQWSTWLAVSRPSSRDFIAAWNAKRWAHGLAPAGAYVGGSDKKKPIVGGKPVWLMAAIVRDYTAPGDLVIDPCAGGGTTLVAAVEAGRIAIGCEPDAERYAIACKRVREARRPIGAPTTAKQLVLGGGQ